MFKRLARVARQWLRTLKLAKKGLDFFVQQLATCVKRDDAVQDTKMLSDATETCDFLVHENQEFGGLSRYFKKRHVVKILDQW